MQPQDLGDPGAQMISSAARSPASLKLGIPNEDATCRFGLHDAAALNPRLYGFTVLAVRLPETAATPSADIALAGC
jgi:hypothetical protein